MLACRLSNAEMPLMLLRVFVREQKRGGVVKEGGSGSGLVWRSNQEASKQPPPEIKILEYPAIALSEATEAMH